MNCLPERLLNSLDVASKNGMTEPVDKPATSKAQGGESLACAMGELLSLLGHDLRTPLAGTMGMLDLVLAGELAPDQRSALEMASASASALLRLIEDFHDLARMETGRFELCPGPFEVRSWSRELVRTLLAGNMECRNEVDPTVPEVLIGDAERMARLILSLTDAYYKHSRPGRLCLRLSLERGTERTFLLVTLGREDVRLTDEERQALIRRDRKVEPVSLAAFRQVGLQQAVVRNLLAALGGGLWPEGGAGERGFQVLAIPVEVPARWRPEADAPTVAESREGQTWGDSEVHILLVEDDDAIRKLVELLLERRGWQVTAVADGLAALESLADRRYDLVLMDVRMPRLDGLETTRRIRSREAADGSIPLPIVGMTAHAALRDRAKCLEAGMDDHLSKPITSERLYRVIENYLAQRR